MISQKCSFFDRAGVPVGEFEVPFLDQATAQVKDAKKVLPECHSLPDGRVFMRKNENSDQYVETPRPCILKYLDGKTEEAKIYQPSPAVVVKGGKSFKRLNEDIYSEVVSVSL